MIDGPDVRSVFVLILNDQTEQIWQSENEFDQRQLLKAGERDKSTVKTQISSPKPYGTILDDKGAKDTL